VTAQQLALYLPLFVLTRTVPNTRCRFGVKELLSVIPTRPTLSSMVDYLLDRMDSLKRSRNSSVPVDFIPILDLRNPNKTIGFELYINFTGMHAQPPHRM
jgi:hypothetical protein